MSQPTHLLWIDLETSGSSPADHDILEIGAILTTPDLTVLDARDWLHGSTVRDITLGQLDPVVIKMHATNDLWRELLSNPEPKPLYEIETEILAWLDDWTSEDTRNPVVSLAGSGVGSFDQQFIREHMPRLAERLTYYVYDVGTIRRFLRLAGLNPAKLTAGKSTDQLAHRALDDIGEHLAEGRDYLSWLRLAGDHTHTPAGFGLDHDHKDDVTIADAVHQLGTAFDELMAQQPAAADNPAA